MELINKIKLIQHLLGLGTVSGMYSIQISHIQGLIGINVVSMVYLFCLLSFYCVEYGCESRLVEFKTEDSKKLHGTYRLLLIFSGVIFSVIEFLNHNPAENAWIYWAKAGFSILGVLFPEPMLKLIFGIAVRR